MHTDYRFTLPPDLRVTQINDEGPIPSFFIRYRDPIESLTRNWNYISSVRFDLAKRIVNEADVLIVQRAFSNESQWLVEEAKSRSIPVVYETDDYLLDLPPQSTYKLSDEKKRSIRSMLGAVDMVTCSTNALARRLREHNGNVKVLDNYAIPMDVSRAGSARRRTPHVAIVNTDYFKLVRGKTELFSALRAALTNLDYRVTFLGSVDASMQELQCDFPDKVLIKGSFMPWRKRFVASLLEHGINVALVPLEKNNYHQFKSDIKFFDFASVGIPGIFNNEEIYTRVIHGQNGFLCEDSYEGWFKGLTYFADERTRIDCGNAAYDAAQERTMSSYAGELRELVMSLHGHSRGVFASRQAIGS